MKKVFTYSYGGGNLDVCDCGFGSFCKCGLNR